MELISQTRCRSFCGGRQNLPVSTLIPIAIMYGIIKLRVALLSTAVLSGTDGNKPQGKEKIVAAE